MTSGFVKKSPWGKYKYCRLPMGVSEPPGKSQEKTKDIFHSFEYIQEYLYLVLLKTKNDWDKHLIELEHVFLHLEGEGLKVNTKTLLFSNYKCEYLGLRVTQDGIWPMAKKVETISNLQPEKWYNNFKYPWYFLTTTKICGHYVHIFLCLWQISQQQTLK